MKNSKITNQKLPNLERYMKDNGLDKIAKEFEEKLFGDDRDYSNNGFLNINELCEINPAYVTGYELKFKNGSVYNEVVKLGNISVGKF